MGLKRQNIPPGAHDRWIYNRMVEAYAARPEYPAPLLERLAQLAGPAPARIADIGAGLGHLSLPLAALGHHVYAVEPAAGMLKALMRRADAAQLSITPHHAAAEDLPLAAASVDLVLVADALHFLNAHRAGTEFARVLTRRGALAFVHVEFGASAFMQSLEQIMLEAAPRRRKPSAQPRTQVAALAGVALTCEARFESELTLDAEHLERVLSSISFIGPAMNAERAAAFHRRVHAIAAPRVWHTTVLLYAGRRGEAR